MNQAGLTRAPQRPSSAARTRCRASSSSGAAGCRPVAAPACAKPASTSARVARIVVETAQHALALRGRSSRVSGICHRAGGIGHCSIGSVTAPAGSHGCVVVCPCKAAGPMMADDPLGTHARQGRRPPPGAPSRIHDMTRQPMAQRRGSSASPAARADRRSTPRSGPPARARRGEADALGEEDAYLFREGTHARLHEDHRLPPRSDGATFRVSAPNALRVTVLARVERVERGSAQSRAARRRLRAGLWRGVRPATRGRATPTSTASSRWQAFDKADPFAFFAEPPPATASRIRTSTIARGVMRRG